MSKTIISMKIEPSINRENDFPPLDNEYKIFQRWEITFICKDENTFDPDEPELSLEEFVTSFTTWTHEALDHHTDSKTILSLFARLMLNTVNDSTERDLNNFLSEIVDYHDMIKESDKKNQYNSYYRKVTHNDAFISFVNNTMPNAKLNINASNINDMKTYYKRMYYFYSNVKLVTGLMTHNYSVSNGIMRGDTRFVHDAPFETLHDLIEWCNNT